MSVKRFGLYLALPTTFDVHSTRIASLLHALNSRQDIKWTIACNSWTRQSLQQLDVDITQFEFIGKKSPSLLHRILKLLSFKIVLPIPAKLRFLKEKGFINPNLPFVNEHPKKRLPFESTETFYLLKKIAQRKDILAWLSPTALCPHFNKITTPHVMCIPDLDFTENPVSFASKGDAFEFVEEAIRGAQYLIAPDLNILQKLVDRYQRQPSNIDIVTPDAANDYIAILERKVTT